MMIPEEYIEMIDRSVKGHESEEDRRRLAKFLSGHPELKEEYESTVQLFRRLKSVKEHAPPAALRHRVMEGIESGRASAMNNSILSNIFSRIRFFTNGRENTMKLSPVMPATRMQWVVAVSVVVVTFVVGYIVGFYPPPSQEQVQGTMGGAEKAMKYQSMQMTENDVVLTPMDVQQMMQSDVMQKMMKDPQMQSAFANQAFVAAVYNGQLQACLSNPDMRAALQNKAFAHQFWGALPAIFANSANLQAVRANQAFQVLQQNQLFAKACQNEKFLPAMVSQSMQSVMANPAFQSAMQNESVRSAMASYNFLQLLSSPEGRAQFASSMQANMQGQMQGQVGAH